MPDRPGEPIELGDDQGVPVSAEIQGALQLSSFADRANLLLENLHSAHLIKLGKLSLEAGDLLDRRGPSVSNEHLAPPYHWDLGGLSSDSIK